MSAKKAAAESTVFGYSPPPEIGLGRDVYKFLQRLDLSCPIKSPRRDLSNGFYVAEILSRFFAVSAWAWQHNLALKQQGHGATRPCLINWLSVHETGRQCTHQTNAKAADIAVGTS